MSSTVFQFYSRLIKAYLHESIHLQVSGPC